MSRRYSINWPPRIVQVQLPQRRSMGTRQFIFFFDDLLIFQSLFLFLLFLKKRKEKKRTKIFFFIKRNFTVGWGWYVFVRRSDMRRASVARSLARSLARWVGGGKKKKTLLRYLRSLFISLFLSLLSLISLFLIVEPTTQDDYYYYYCKLCALFLFLFFIILNRSFTSDPISIIRLI